MEEHNIPLEEINFDVLQVRLLVMCAWKNRYHGTPVSVPF